MMQAYYFLDYWIFLAAKGSRLHNKVFDQLLQKLNVNNAIRSKPPVTNLNGILTNMHNLEIDHVR